MLYLLSHFGLFNGPNAAENDNNTNAKSHVLRKRMLLKACVEVCLSPPPSTLFITLDVLFCVAAAFCSAVASAAVAAAFCSAVAAAVAQSQRLKVRHMLLSP